MKNKYLIGSILIILSSMMVIAQNMNVAGSLNYATDNDSPFYALGSQVACTNHTDEVTAYSVVIPANTMGSNGVLRVNTLMGVKTSSTNNKTIVWRLGGTVIKRINLNGASDSSLSTQLSLWNRNDPKIQIGLPVAFTPSISYSINGGSLATYAIDTTVNQTFTVGLSNAVVTDSTTLEYIYLNIIKSP